MSAVKDLETKLDKLFSERAPQLSAGIRKILFEWAPWIALVVGILSLLSALGLWSSARDVHNSAYYIQQICSTYDGGNGKCDVPSGTHLTFWVWIAIIFMIIQGVLYLRAYPRLRERQKSGWDYLYYAGLVYVAYAIITLLTGFDVIGHFIGAAIGVVISFYLLFQIRPLYTERPPLSAPPVIETHAAETTTISPVPTKAKPARTTTKATKKKPTPKKKSPTKKSAKPKK